MSDDIEKLKQAVNSHESRLGTHETRIQSLERDAKELSIELQGIQSSLVKMELMLHTVNRDISYNVANVEKSIKLAIAEHESHEFSRQRSLMIWVATSLLTALGAVLWAVFEVSVMKASP